MSTCGFSLRPELNFCGTDIPVVCLTKKTYTLACSFTKTRMYIYTCSHVCRSIMFLCSLLYYEPVSSLFQVCVTTSEQFDLLFLVGKHFNAIISLRACTQSTAPTKTNNDRRRRNGRVSHSKLEIGTLWR